MESGLSQLILKEVEVLTRLLKKARKKESKKRKEI